MFIISSLYGGGAERVVSRVASALCEEHDVHIAVLSPLMKKGGVYDHDPRIHIHEIIPNTSTSPIVTRKAQSAAIRMMHAIKRRMVAKGLFRLTNAAGKMVKGQITEKKTARQARCDEIRRLKKELGIEISISFMTEANYCNVQSRNGEPAIISIRNILNTPYADDQRFTPEAHEQIRLTSELADGIVAVSQNVAREQAEVYGADPGKIVTIYNPVDVDDLRARSKKALDDPDFERLCSQHKRIILTMGRHVYQKGQWHLIRAMKAVRSTCPDAALVILGQGPLTERLKAVIRANGLEDHVLLAGFQDPFPYMSRCDVFCLSSLFEGFSNALLEAMSCGMPLVATDCNSSPRELMAPESDPAIQTESVEETPYGLLVPPLSGNLSLLADPLEPEEAFLAEALSAMLDDTKMRQRCRENGSVRIRDFATERIVAQWSETIEAFVKGHHDKSS